MIPVHVVSLNDEEWNVLLALKREFTPEEIQTFAMGGTRSRSRVCRSKNFAEIAEALNGTQSHWPIFHFP